MPFSLLKTIREFAAPKRQLSCATRLWRQILAELARRTENRHESGAFLLGEQSGATRRILRAVYYDDLDAHAYDTGACIIRGPAFAKLWKICRDTGLAVVADVHVHPGASSQSWEDKTNPTLPNRGHVSIIVPNFARSPISVQDLGLFEYVEKYNWLDLGHKRARRHFYVGLFG